MADALALENVLYEKKNGIAYVTINRPKVLKALNTHDLTDLKAAFENANAPTAVTFSLETANEGMGTSQAEGFALEASYFDV